MILEILNKISFKKRLPQALCLVVCFIFYSCKNDLKTLPSDTKTDYESDRAYDVQFIYSQQGKTKAQLFTKEFLKNDNAKPPYMDMLKSVRVNFFNDSLIIDSKLTAKYARYYSKSGDILVRDSVIVINQNNDKLETEELIWNQKLEKFFTEKFVKITSGGHVSYGEGMEANRDFSWFRIYSQRGTVPMQSDDIPVAE